MAMLVLKITVVLALGLIVASMLRRVPAAVRHLVLASTLAATVAIPAAGWLMPAVSVRVPSPSALAVAIADSSVRDRRPIESADVVPAARVVPTAPPYSPSALLYLAWTAGALICLCSLVIALARLARLRRTAVPWQRGQLLMDSISADAGMRRTIDVARHEAIRAPVTGGFGTPLVLVPREADSWDDQDLRQAFLHELEHIHRHDWGLQVAARALCAVYWFHPLAWLACRRLCLEAERACDDAVVARTEGAAYAQQLVTLAQRVTSAEAVPMLSMAGRSDLSVRVRALLDATMPRGRAGRRAVLMSVAAAGVIVAALSPLRAAGASRKTADDQAPRLPAAQSAIARALGDLIESAQRGNVRDVSELLAAGADVNTVIEGDGTALIAAARSDRLEMVTFLVEQGADVNLGVEGDGNPLIMASQRGAREVVQYLLDRGADVNASVKGDGSPLIVAARSKQLPLVSLLVEHGANVNLGVEGDGNPLIAASASGAGNIVQYLLDHGADIEAVVPSDENALINASANGHLAVVRLLVERGANVNAGVWKENVRQSQDGTWSTFPEYRSPLSSAIRNGHRDVVDFLRTNGATN
jgi:ankyrin repeat protein/beta-lactamase regulating signal transducer with metallopeptidase domain